MQVDANKEKKETKKKTKKTLRSRSFALTTFVFSVKGMISVMLTLVVAVYQQILSSTEQGFIGLLRGNQTSMF